DRLLDRSRFLGYSHLLLLSAPKKSGAGLLHTGAATLPSVFSGVARHQFSFSFRFGFTISKVMGWTGCATPFFFSSLSSCSLDFFFLFLSLASPRPEGIGPSINPAGSFAGPVEHTATGRRFAPTYQTRRSLLRSAREL